MHVCSERCHSRAVVGMSVAIHVKQLRARCGMLRGTWGSSTDRCAALHGWERLQMWLPDGSLVVATTRTREEWSRSR